VEAIWLTSSDRQPNALPYATVCVRLCPLRARGEAIDKTHPRDAAVACVCVCVCVCICVCVCVVALMHWSVEFGERESVCV
jgi:hypothetical protein